MHSRRYARSTIPTPGCFKLTKEQRVDATLPHLTYIPNLTQCDVCVFKGENSAEWA